VFLARGCCKLKAHDDGSARASQLAEGIWLVTVHGEHDLSTQNQLALEIARVDLSRAVLIDFSDADFIDSSILRVLVFTAEEADSRGGIVLVVSPRSGHPYRVFEITSTSGVLNVYETRDEALRAVPAQYRTAPR
jgi:anti-anti-sigma factor